MIPLQYEWLQVTDINIASGVYILPHYRNQLADVPYVSVIWKLILFKGKLGATIFTHAVVKNIVLDAVEVGDKNLKCENKNLTGMTIVDENDSPRSLREHQRVFASTVILNIKL